MMPARCSVPSIPVPTDDVCRDCAGGLVIPDPDGSLTGVVGTPVPCGCMGDPRADADCACQLEGWPWNDGHTGWVPVGITGDPEPWYAPCPAHPTTRWLEVPAA